LSGGRSSPPGGSCQNLENWVIPEVSLGGPSMLPSDSSPKTQKMT